MENVLDLQLIVAETKDDPEEMFTDGSHYSIGC
jgi:hypothetical protein